MKIRRLLYPIVIFLFFAIVVILLDLQALSAPVYYDSAGNIIEKEHIFASHGLMGVVGNFRQRPAPMATFYLNYLVGGTNPFGFRIVNALALAAAGVMLAVVVGLALRITHAPPRLSDRERTALALAAGLIFVIHPVQVFVTVYIWQRMALFAELFCLTGLAAYLATRTGSLRPAAGYPVCFAAVVVAMLSKENAAIFPAILCLAEIGLFHEGWSKRLKRMAVLVGVTFVVVGGLSFLERAHGMEKFHSGIAATLQRYFFEGGITPIQLAMNQCRLLFDYLAIILYPEPSRLHLVTPVAVAPLSFSDPVTFASMAGVGLLAAAGVYLLRKRPLSGLGLLFFIAALLPEALLIPQYLFVVYRASFPMVGILLVGADLSAGILERAHKAGSGRAIRVAVAAAFCVGIVFMGSGTLSLAKRWNDPVELWSAAARRVPAGDSRIEKIGMIQIFNSLGIAFLNKGKFEEAADAHRRAVETNPRMAMNYVYLGTALERGGKLDEAESALKQALSLNPRDAPAHELLGRLAMSRGQTAEALGEFRKAAEIEPENPYLHVALGRALLKQKQYAEAIASLDAALRLHPRSPDAHYSMGKALMATGRLSDAESRFRKTLDLKPDYAVAHNDLGVIFARTGRFHLAVAHFREALKINPSDLPAQANLRAALAQIGGEPAGGARQR